MTEIGKFPSEFMEKNVYPRLGAPRGEVLVGPGNGHDNAVIRLGCNKVLVTTADPLSVIPALGFQDSAYISVHLIASDLATCGFSPQFFIVNLNLPPKMLNKEFEDYWSSIHAECQKLGVAIVGGHTGRYLIKLYGSRRRSNDDGGARRSLLGKQHGQAWRSVDDDERRSHSCNRKYSRGFFQKPWKKPTEPDS